MESNEIIIVSGLQRSGTSMMMQMLEAGGVKPYIDKLKLADKYNPKGYYEYTALYKRPIDFTFLKKLKGQSLKVYAILLPHLPKEYSYKIIFMNRDFSEVVVSSQHRQMKAHRKYLSVTNTNINKFQRVYEKANLWIKQQTNVDVLNITYADTLNNPIEIATKVNDFLGGNLDVEKMTQVVDKSLHYILKSNIIFKIDRSPKEIVHLIEKYAKGKAYCEVGIGEGDNLNLVEGVKEKFGVEIAKYGVQRCKEKYPHLDIKFGSILDYLPTIHFDVCFMWLTYPRNKEIVNAILDKNENTIVLMGLNYFYHLKKNDEKYKKYIKMYTKIADAPNWNMNIDIHLKELIENGFNVDIQQVTDEDGEIFSVAIIQKNIN